MNEDYEVWRSVTEPDLEGDYLISNKGRFAKVLKGRRDPNTGYIQYIFSKRRVYYRSFRIHQLVARAFIGPQPEGTVVNHKDCNKTNNEPSNLEYVTQAENVRHGICMRRRAINKNPINGQFKPLLTVDQVGEIKCLLQYPNLPLYLIAADYGVSVITIRRIKLGQNWNRVPAKP